MQHARMAQIRAILMDVDGVLTDGRIVYSSDGGLCGSSVRRKSM